MPERLPRRERVRRRRDGLLRPRQRHRRVPEIEIVERDLHQRRRMARLQLHFPLEFVDRLLRLLLQQVHAVGVVHVRRLGIAVDERLERFCRGRDPRRHHVARAAGHHHHVPAFGRRLDREHRHTQRGEAHGFDDAGVVVSFGGEFAERLERLLVLLDPRHQDRGVKARDAPELFGVSDAEHTRLQQVLQRPVVLLQAELAQAEKGIGGAVPGREPHDFAKRVAAMRLVVERVVRSALIPIAFDVVRLELDRFAVQLDGLFPALPLARFGRRFHQPIELGGTCTCSGTCLRRCCDTAGFWLRGGLRILRRIGSDSRVRSQRGCNHRRQKREPDRGATTRRHPRTLTMSLAVLPAQNG